MKKEQKLPKEFKEKWLKALRSDNYKKGKMQLVKEITGEKYFCCLGVACDIVGAKIPNSKQYITGFHDNGSNRPIKGISKIPKILRGMRENKIVEELTIINDNSDNFDKVIEYIHKNL